MYRTNFYSQSSLLKQGSHNLTIRNKILERLPGGPSLTLTTWWPTKDIFSGPSSRFEDKLHQEVVALNKRTNDLDEKIKTTNINQLTAEEQQSLMQEYSMIQRTKELLALIVDNMQKCAANIAANFR